MTSANFLNEKYHSHLFQKKIIAIIVHMEVQRYIHFFQFCSETEKADCLALVDFLRGLVEFDPNKRWSPLQVFTEDTGTFTFLGIIFSL